MLKVLQVFFVQRLGVRGVLCVWGVRCVLPTFRTVVMYRHFDETGLLDISKLSRSNQNFQFFTWNEKMVLCQLKPLHKIYYVSIDQCLPWGRCYG